MLRNYVFTDAMQKVLADEIKSSLLSVYPKATVECSDVESLMDRPPEGKFGDVAFPCFRLSKTCGDNPQKIAQRLSEEIATRIKANNSYPIEAVQIEGAFLNLQLSATSLSSGLLSSIQSGSYFAQVKSQNHARSRRIMVEHSNPNTHKEFHVGHLRNVCLGDSMVRIHRFLGDTVVAANYLGDEGTHIAKCLWWILSNQKQVPATAKGEWLGEMYAEASRALAAASENDAELKKKMETQISAVLSDIEARKGDAYRLWQETRQWSLDMFAEIYKWLDVQFDQYFYESELSESSQQIVDEYFSKGVFKLSDGAIGSDLSDYKLGFMIVRKSDGNTLYATKDLALARRKFEDFSVETSIYVVGNEQNLHFRQVFKTLELMGFSQAKDCFHLSYGHVRLPQGKMSSRDGTSISLSILREEVSEALNEPLTKIASSLNDDELAVTRRNLTLGAIKYGMLSVDAQKDVVFKLEDWVSFEGDSGPYVMYSYARAKSILRKFSDVSLDNLTLSQYSTLSHESERFLMRYLQDFNSSVVGAANQCKPNIVANHIFDMCKAFNRFYTQVSVTNAESENHRVGRLALIQAFSTVLKTGLDLLGIETLERM